MKENITIRDIDAVIFDMDGVIFDSERVFLECCIEAGKRFNLERVEEVCLLCVGITSEMTEKLLLEEYGPDFPLKEFRGDSMEFFWKRYDEEGQLPVKTGVRELLELLSKQGRPLAIASSTKSDVVKRQLKDAGLLDFFDKVIGGEQVSRSKPEPDIFLSAAKALGVAPEKCLVIEDSHNGIRAAHTAGMIPIMVPDLLPVTDEMKEKAWKIFPSLVEVAELFR